MVVFLNCFDVVVGFDDVVGGFVVENLFGWDCVVGLFVVFYL